MILDHISNDLPHLCEGDSVKCEKTKETRDCMQCGNEAPLECGQSGRRKRAYSIYDVAWVQSMYRDEVIHNVKGSERVVF